MWRTFSPTNSRRGSARARIFSSIVLACIDGANNFNDKNMPDKVLRSQFLVRVQLGKLILDHYGFTTQSRLSKQKETALRILFVWLTWLEGNRGAIAVAYPIMKIVVLYLWEKFDADIIIKLTKFDARLLILFEIPSEFYRRNFSRKSFILCVLNSLNCSLNKRN